MSQSLHAIPNPHFGCHFDGHMNVKPFAQQQENGGLNLNRKKSVTHAAEHDLKVDVEAGIDSRNQHQLEEKAQGFETKKSSAAPESDAEDGTDVKRLNDDLLQKKAQWPETKKSSAAPESDAEDGTDVKRLKDDFTDNNKNQSASDDIKPLGARPLKDIINERRISQGRRPLTNEDFFLQHRSKCRSFCKSEPPTTTALLPPLFRDPLKQERDGPIRNRLNKRLPPHPKSPPPIDPQKFREMIAKYRHMKQSAKCGQMVV